MNVFEYAAITEANWKANLEAMGNFVPQFTFYSDFSIAEYCEVYKDDAYAVRDTYNRVIEAWAEDYKALTEVVLMLNHKAWAFSDRVDSHYLGCSDERAEKYVNLYVKLYEEAVDEFMTRYGNNQEAMDYYFQVTD